MRLTSIVGMGVAAAVLTVWTALAQAPVQHGAQDRASTGSAGTASPARLYRPQGDGRPVEATGAASRGDEEQAGVVLLAAPEGGLTAQPSPTLYLFLRFGQPRAATVKLFDASDAGGTALATIALPPPLGPGLVAIDLAKHGVSLKPGRDHIWTVELQAEGARSNSGFPPEAVLRYEPTPSLAANADLPIDARARRAAGEGYWYDSLDLLTRGLAATPAAIGLTDLRVRLLREGGHAVAADWAQSLAP